MVFLFEDTAMPIQLDGLASSPALYPLAYDPARDALMFVRMTRPRIARRASWTSA